MDVEMEIDGWLGWGVVGDELVGVGELESMEEMDGMFVFAESRDSNLRNNDASLSLV